MTYNELDINDSVTLNDLINGESFIVRILDKRDNQYIICENGGKVMQININHDFDYTFSR